MVLHSFYNIFIENSCKLSTVFTDFTRIAKNEKLMLVKGE